MKTRSISRNYFRDFNWQESYASLVLGAIIVVILGLLTANFFAKRNQDISSGEQTARSEQEAQKLAQQAKAGEYKVVAGDSLTSIAEKTYGSQEYYVVIARANKIANPNVIFVDSTIKLPSKQEAETLRANITATTYLVQSGDTLFTISEKMYGDGSQWSVIARANNVTYLSNGNPLIYAGSALTIPR